MKLSYYQIFNTANTAVVPSTGFAFTSQFNAAYGSEETIAVQNLSKADSKLWDLDYTINFGTGSGDTGTTVTPAPGSSTPNSTTVSGLPSNHVVGLNSFTNISTLMYNSSGQLLTINDDFVNTYGKLNVTSSNPAVVNAFPTSHNNILLIGSGVSTTPVTISYWYGNSSSTFAGTSNALKHSFTVIGGTATGGTIITPTATPTVPTGNISFTNIPRGTTYMNSTGSSVNVRTSASTSGSKVDKVNKGDTRVVVGEENGWKKIMQGNGYAYVINSYAKIYTLNEDAYRGYAKSKLTVRSSASSSASRLHYITKGGDVIIVGESGSYYKIATQGSYGYVPMSSVTLYK